MNRDEARTPVAAQAPVSALPESTGRAAYATPRLERLGSWNALTLQQSIPIFP